MIKSLCAEVLGINRKNIYYHSIQDDKDEQLKQVIETVWIKHPAYGHKRLGDASADKF